MIFVDLRMNNKLRKLGEEVSDKVDIIEAAQKHLMREIEALKEEYSILEKKKKKMRQEEKRIKLRIVEQHRVIRENYRSRVLEEERKEKEYLLKRVI